MIEGLLWQQKDRFFSRWKERFFILTQVLLGINNNIDELLKPFQDYLHCFKKESSRITEMGGFIFKVSPHFYPFFKTYSCLQCKLCEVEEASLSLSLSSCLSISVWNTFMSAVQAVWGGGGFLVEQERISHSQHHSFQGELVLAINNPGIIFKNPQL